MQAPSAVPGLAHVLSFFFAEGSSMAERGFLKSFSGRTAYEAAVQETWRHSRELSGGESALLRELVRYATLAASSHNTQCWRFRIEKNAISILPDFRRRCPTVDPDDHHLFVSLGCAAENLIQAAAVHGLKGNTEFDSHAGEVVRVSLAPSKPLATPLFQAIPERQSTRREYDGQPLSREELALLAKNGTGNGVQVFLLTENKPRENVLDFVTQGNTVQMKDRAFVTELKAWIRFNGGEAVRTGDGLFAASSDNPTVPTWLGKLIFDWFFIPARENDRYAKQIRSSAGIAVFVSDADNKTHWIEAGRCYQRFALQATALGIRTAFLNQPLGVPNLRPQFASFLGIGNRRPDLIVRFGRGAKLPPSLRRPVDAVLV